MPPMGLRLRLTIPLACVLIAYGGLDAYLTGRTQRAEILAEATLSTLRLANTVRRSTRHAMLQSRRDDVHEMIREIGEQPGIEHVRIMNKEGIIIYSSDQSEINRVVDRKAEGCIECHVSQRPLTTIETSKRARVFQSPHGYRTLAAIDVVDNEPSCWNASCHAHRAEESLLGVIDIGVSLKEADERVARASRHVVLFGLASTIVICGLVGLLVYRLVNRPVQSLLECTRKVAEGDLDCAIPATSGDEIGHLGRSFSKMTEDLRRARNELSNWAHRLEEEVENKTRDLRLAQAQIVRSEKLSSVGLLAAGVAHELNNPLTGILTFAHMLAKQLPENSSEREQAKDIAVQADRCAIIIRQLLDLSRERSPEMSRQDLSVVMEQAIAVVENQPRFHNITIERHFDPALPSILMDAGQMQQVFLNLMVNAGEAMPNGGCLRIEAWAPTSALRSRSAAGTVGTDQVQICFRDNGVGIPPENIGKIFDPFFTTKEVGRGTGLGLAVSYGIIERHGGTIAVESTLGLGSSFTITLPVCGSADESV